MVAISLYKGNLHKSPNLPRRWLCPTPNISLKDFRILLRRRDRTLSRLRASNPSPKPHHSTDPSPSGNAVINSSNGDSVNTCPQPELPPKGVLKEGEAKDDGRAKEDWLVEGEGSLKKLVDATDALVKEENFENGDKVKPPENSLAVEKTNTENGESNVTDVEKRKTEILEKLEALNEKKHSLVQVLKQILKAEEQLKRQNNMQQGMSSRPPLPLQVDTTATDSGSVTRLNTPKTGSDGNPSGDMEGGEPNDVSNHNSARLTRMSSTSPSSNTQLRKPASNMVGHPPRAATGALPPSPAASGGTSAGRLPSPWN